MLPGEGHGIVCTISYLLWVTSASSYDKTYTAYLLSIPYCRRTPPRAATVERRKSVFRLKLRDTNEGLDLPFPPMVLQCFPFA